MSRTLSHAQNFLKSPELVTRLIRNSAIHNGDLVYDIGAGTGMITEALQRHGCTVVAVEFDKTLFERLKQRFHTTANVHVLHEDFLRHSLPSHGVYKVFSNIPFNQTADIMHKILSAKNPPLDTYCILQRESALKFSGLPFGRETQYSLLAKPRFAFAIPATLRRSDFSPRPRVDTVLLHIHKREQPLLEEHVMQLYRDFIIYGFNQWKPTLRESLKKVFTSAQGARLFHDLKVPQSAKPTDITCEQWLGLFQYFHRGVVQEKQYLVHGAEQALRGKQKKLHKIHRTRARR